jgi:hypothetical protein
MGLLSREIVRRAAPLVAMGVAGAAGAVLAQRRLTERRRLTLTPGPPPGASRPSPAATGPVPPGPPGPPGPPTPTPEPPSPTPDPIPGPTPPAPDPVPPTPTPTPQPGVAIAGDASQGPEAAVDAVVEPSAQEMGLEQVVRSALLEAAPDGAGMVDVEAAGGMVVLRGQVDSPDTIRELERTAAGVPGVETVRVLLHLPGRARRRSA